MANGPPEEGAYQCFFNRDDLPSPMEGGTLCDFPLAQLSGFPDHEEHFPLYTGARLERMGILRPDGEVNVEVMRAFVQIFGGLFFDDLCDFYSDQGEVSAVTAAFSELAARKDCQNIYLLISLQYDTIRKPLPDPIWWLAGCAPALSLFCLGFVERLLELSENQASNGKEMVANETADCCTG